MLQHNIDHQLKNRIHKYAQFCITVFDGTFSSTCTLNINVNCQACYDFKVLT